MRRRTQLSLMIVIVSLLVLSDPLPHPVRAAETTPLLPIAYVAMDGDDSHSCETPAARCATLQHALANLADGGEVRLAGGLYPATTMITRSAVIAGGYALPDFIISNAPTVLHGQFQGTTLSVLGPVQVRLRQVTITGGRATAQTNGRGGGIYASGADVALDRVDVRNNIASAPGGIGGGLYVNGGSLTLAWSTIRANVALRTQLISQEIGSWNHERPLDSSEQISTPTEPAGSGGGIYAINAVVSLDSSQITGNRSMKINALATQNPPRSGQDGGEQARGASGGLYAENCVVATRNTSFASNQALADSNSSDVGGAILLINSQANINGGEIRDNLASAAHMTSAGNGIGIVGGDTLVTNVGLWNNGAATDNQQGAGISLRPAAEPQASAAITLTNVLLAQHPGAALALLPGDQGATARASVRYATLVSNTIGLQASADQAITVTNSIIAGGDLAAQALPGGEITLNYTDRYGNAASASGNVVIGPAGDLALPPGFAPSSDMTFPLAPDSPLIDRGTQIAGVVSDFEGHPRSIDGNSDGIAQPDLGWDEFAHSAVGFGPDQTLFAMPGQVLTTTIDLRNDGLQIDDFSITADAMDGWNAVVLPSHMRLGQRGRVRLTVVIRVPSTAPLNTQALVLLHARGQTSAATARIFVDIGEP